MLKKIILILIVLLVMMQFIPVDHSNAPLTKANDFIAIYTPPAEMKGILLTSCYDCHSNETTYPWYTHVAPLSWWLKHHVDEGREELNFSNWGTYTEKRKQHKLEECIEEVSEEEMPLSSYTIIHQKAALSPSKREALSAWLKTLVIKKP